LEQSQNIFIFSAYTDACTSSCKIVITSKTPLISFENILGDSLWLSNSVLWCRCPKYLYIGTHNFATAMYQNLKEINTSVFSEFCRKSWNKYVIWRFSIMQIRKVMTSLVVQLKLQNTEWNISLEILKQCFPNLAPEMCITKDTKQHLLYCCHDNNSAAGPVLIKTTIPSFCLNQGPSTPVNLIVRVKTIWLPCLLQTGASVLR